MKDADPERRFLALWRSIPWMRRYFSSREDLGRVMYAHGLMASAIDTLTSASSAAPTASPRD